MMVPDFDRFLEERRRGLLVEEHLSDVLMDVQDTPFLATPDRPTATSSPQPFRTPSHSRTASLTSPGPTTSPLPTTPRPKAKSKWSFLSPRKTPVSSPAAEQPSHVPYQARRVESSGDLSATSHAKHYEATANLKVESLVADSPRKGVWSPAPADAAQGDLRDLLEDDEADQTQAGSESPTKGRTARQVALSQVLDNVVVRVPLWPSPLLAVGLILTGTGPRRRSWKSQSRSSSAYISLDYSVGSTLRACYESFCTKSPHSRFDDTF